MCSMGRVRSGLAQGPSPMADVTDFKDARHRQEKQWNLPLKERAVEMGQKMPTPTFNGACRAKPGSDRR
jgi:hypothetical protein